MGWRELKVLPVSSHDELARILSKVEDIGVWPDGLLDAYIAMIPKTDGDATPLGQRPLSVLPVVYRIWASVRMGQLDLCARKGFRGGPWLDIDCTVQVLNSDHVRERDMALLRSILVGGVWNGFLLDRV